MWNLQKAWTLWRQMCGSIMPDFTDPLCCQILLSIRAQMSSNTIADDSSAMSSNVVYILYFIAYGRASD